MMYKVELKVADEPVFSITASENWEQTWMAAGLDLLPLEGAPAVQLEQDAWYANENLKASPDYYGNIFPDYYESVLHFLDRLVEAGQEWPEAQVEVTY